MIRLLRSICIFALVVLPRVARSQPVDAGVADAQAPPDAQAPHDAPPANGSGPPATEEPPGIVKQTPPIYPDVPKDKRKIVDVQVHVEVDASGNITDSRVVSAPNPPFDDLAVATVLTWTFEPAKQNGQAVASHTTITVRFDPNAPLGETIEVHGETPATAAVKAPEAGAADIRYSTEKIASAIPHQEGATGLLKHAPGFLLTNEGGEGHAEQIFLRGFDARDGQDIEIKVGGDVVNQAGNLHGNGYADLHFIISELVEGVRVLEGPYDPRQGNFAVAGSAEYDLGLAKRGLSAIYELGSYNTKRALLLFGPESSGPHTFGGVEVYSTDGYGQNRDARHAIALGQVEGKLGDHGAWRITGGAYVTDYHSAGVIREDDYEAGRKGFYDTYDFGQGGSVDRAFVLGALDHHHEDTTWHHQFSLTAQAMNLREDFTGFLLDQQQSYQQPHSQRGDLIDLESDGFTAQASGFLRKRHDWLGYTQEFELGYFGRIDAVSGTQYRLESAIAGVGDRPYHKDTDLDAVLGDVGLYAATNLKFTKWLVLRGGVRSDLLTYNVIDNCAVHDIAHPNPMNPPGDASCLSQADFGVYREPVQRATASGSVLLPRATVLVGPWQDLTASASYGEGVRSIDPTYISQDIKTPFANIKSGDVGLQYQARPFDINTLARLSLFETHVDHDLIFNETVGRNTLANGTTRQGGSISLQASNSWLEEIASATLVQSTFDDTHLLVPYVPDFVARTDTIAFGQIPSYTLAGKPLFGQAGVGVTYVGRRALPYGERSDVIFTIDGSAQITWDRYTLGLKASNLLDTKYRLGEYNYVSDFHSQAEPTLAVAREFVAGAPRLVLLHLEVKL